jgi:hypothetical protein
MSVAARCSYETVTGLEADPRAREQLMLTCVCHARDEEEAAVGIDRKGLLTFANCRKLSLVSPVISKRNVLFMHVCDTSCV